MIDMGKAQSPRKQVKVTLQNISTFDARDLLFDFWVTTDPGEKQRSYEVLVVAAQKSIVHRYLDGFKRLKLSCTHMDVSPCAMATLLGKLLPSESIVGTVVLGEQLGYFAVGDKQKVLFWRPFELPPAKNGQQANHDRVGDEVSKCVSHMVGTLHLDAMMDIYMFGTGSQHEADRVLSGPSIQHEGQNAVPL